MRYGDSGGVGARVVLIRVVGGAHLLNDTTIGEGPEDVDVVAKGTDAAFTKGNAIALIVGHADRPRFAIAEHNDPVAGGGRRKAPAAAAPSTAWIAVAPRLVLGGLDVVDDRLEPLVRDVVEADVRAGLLELVLHVADVALGPDVALVHLVERVDGATACAGRRILQHAVDITDQLVPVVPRPDLTHNPPLQYSCKSAR